MAYYVSGLQEYKGNISFEVGRDGQQFSVGFEKNLGRGQNDCGRAAPPGSDIPRSLWGDFNVPHYSQPTKTMLFGLKLWPGMNCIRSMNTCQPCEEFVNVDLQSTNSVYKSMSIFSKKL